MDRRAHQTLRLRSFWRQFKTGGEPELYYQLLRDTNRPLDERLTELFDAYPNEFKAADQEAICAELGNRKFDSKIATSIARAVRKSKHWVLLGGPPCQAYSLVGRSRNRGNADYVASEDGRQYLYQEYLRAIAEHLPSVFVMENVKGLLSATVANENIFERIVHDLQEPGKSLGMSRRKRKGMNQDYQLFAVGGNDLFGGTNLSDFVIRMEDHGVPQARHRLIILGIRSDLGVKRLPRVLDRQDPVPARKVLDDLPVLRSGLSKEKDSDGHWERNVASALESDWIKKMGGNSHEISVVMRAAIQKVSERDLDRGGEWVRSRRKCKYLPDWYRDSRIKGVFNHETRGHITADLHRYLFAASYAKAVGVSPSLRDFPKQLLPNHKNAHRALNGSLFSDRFRVQLHDRPSTTVTCHISKDGHYYIHPDPSQCRSLTVREAARLQTFPDNYFFCGPRTSQYTQVGNAVPPYLAHQIAGVVHSILCSAGVATS